ncbi:hypothetical protein J6590_096703, partial [Homalodisca vitripennis]
MEILVPVKLRCKLDIIKVSVSDRLGIQKPRTAFTNYAGDVISFLKEFLSLKLKESL